MSDLPGHTRAAPTLETGKSDAGRARGILNPAAGKRRFRLSRHAPSQELDLFVEHYWMVNWDLRDRGPYLQETLPHPCVHLVIERGASRIYGVMNGKFSYLLSDRGSVFGIKFRPGGFYPFYRSPVSGLTDGSIGLRDAYGDAGKALEDAILSLWSERDMVEVAETFLRKRLPERDANVATINLAADLIAADRGITRVDDAARRLGLSKRTLQRLFARYAGVGPKWVIRRYRLHEAAERIADGKIANWPQLALELGYFDQAHFIKDFKAITGLSPAEYARSIASDGQAIPTRTPTAPGV